MFQLFLTPEFLQENAQYQNHVDRLKELIVEQVSLHHFLEMSAFPRIVSAVTFQEGPENGHLRENPLFLLVWAYA